MTIARALAGLLMAARVASAEPAAAPQPVDYELSFDPQLRPLMFAEDFQTAAELISLGKDELLTTTLDLRGAPSVVQGAARLSEYVLIDLPLAQLSQVFPHELFGHGGRAREFGGTATYSILVPFPWSELGGSEGGGFTYPTYTRALTADEATLEPQGGIGIESAQRRLLLEQLEASGELTHGAQSLYALLNLHLWSDALLNAGDLEHWTSVQATHYGVSASALRRQFLIASSVVELLDPTFLYSMYGLFDRFVVHGERSARLPALTIADGYDLWFATDLDPVPWGLQGEASIFLRTHGWVLEAAPAFGTGPGGQSLGLELAWAGLRYGPLRARVELDLWRQPTLDVSSDGTQVGGLGAPANTDGIRGEAELTYEAPRWFLGVRLGGKTAGLLPAMPIAPTLEGMLVGGVRV